MTTPTVHERLEWLHPGDSVTALVDVSGETRRAFITGEPDTFFSVPARISWHGRKVAGYVTIRTVQGYSTATPADPAVYVFIGAPGRENRERAERIAAAVITEAGTAAGTPGSRYGSTIRECAPIIGAYAVIFENDSGESLEDGAGGWDFTAALHGIISAVVNDSPEPGAWILERGPLYGFNPAAYDLEPADYDLEGSYR